MPGYRLYRTGAGWLFLAVDSDDEWRRCWLALGAPEHADDARFATPAARAANDAELSTLLADLLGKRPADEWEQRMIAARVAGVRADASTPGPFFAHHEQVLANDLSPECTHARFGTHRRWGPIVRVNGGGPAGPGVLAGEHTDVILAALGRSPDDIAALRAVARGGVGADRLGGVSERATARLRHGNTRASRQGWASWPISRHARRSTPRSQRSSPPSRSTSEPSSEACPTTRSPTRER